MFLTADIFYLQESENYKCISTLRKKLTRELKSNIPEGKQEFSQDTMLIQFSLLIALCDQNEILTASFVFIIF